MTTIGISKKVLADLLVSLAGFALTYFAADLDPTTAAIISKLAGTLAGYLAPPNDTQVDAIPAGSVPPAPGP